MDNRSEDEDITFGNLFDLSEEGEDSDVLLLDGTRAAAGNQDKDGREEGNPEAESRLSAYTLARPGQWGAFRFSRKQPRGSGEASGRTHRFGSYEVTCPYHILSRDKKSLCKKAIVLEGLTENDQLSALRLARHWSLQATEHKYQFQHVHFSDLASPPSFSELEQRLQDKGLLERPNMEDIMDDEQMLAIEAPDEQARLKTARSKKGKGKGRQRQRRAQSNQARDGGGAASSSSVAPAEAAANAAASAASSSSSSSSDSSDSSSS